MHINFTDHLLQTISWTFIHSLWQGLILSVIAGLFMLLTKKSSASLRYMLLTGIFFLFICAVVMSFIIEWNTFATGDNSAVTGNTSTDTGMTVYQAWVRGMIGAVSAFLTANADRIVLIWTIVIFIKSVKILFDLMYVSRLRSEHICSPGEAWLDRIKELAKGIGIHKTVRFAESALVKVPLVIGHLKPVILMPAGILNSLSPGEVEAVLLHELAHIRRHDYLVNFIQTISETILFFNPAFLWVSSLMRIERENCCDDIAIAETSNRLQFAEALISFREFSMDPQRYAMGLFGRKNILLQRMTRIVYKKNKTLSVFESVFLSVNLLFFSLLVMGIGNEQEGRKAEAVMQESGYSYTIPKQVSDPVEKTETVDDDQPQPVRHAPVQKEKTRQGVASARVPGDVKTIEAAREEAEAKEIFEHIIHAEAQQISELRQSELQRLQADQDRQQAEVHRQQAEHERTIAEEHRKMADIARAEAQIHREEAEKNRLLAEKDREEAEKNRQVAEQQRKKSEEDRQRAAERRHIPAEVRS